MVQRSTTADKAEDAWSDDPPTPKPAARFALINRNILNHPLARDRRTPQKWIPGNRTRDWYCSLPGDPCVQLRLPASMPREACRCPTAFDINVLFTLLSEAKAKSTTTITFTRGKLLERIGLTDHSKNRASVDDAITLWSRMQISFHKWYFPRINGQLPPNGPRTLPPPAKEYAKTTRGIRITLHPIWTDLTAHGYFARAAMPLPHHVPGQNLCLWLLTAYRRPKGEDRRSRFGGTLTYQLSTDDLCTRIGLTRGRGLSTAVEQAKRWFGTNAGKLEWISTDQLNRFNIVESRRRGQDRSKRTPREVSGDDYFSKVARWAKRVRDEEAARLEAEEDD